MRRAVLVALATVALVTGAMAVASTSMPASGPTNRPPGVQPASALATPLLSPRRMPSLVARAVGDTRLGLALDAALDTVSSARSCLAVEIGGRRLYARRVDDALTPASTLKVLTGMAALRALGADFRFRTDARAVGAIDGAGILQGELWLVGSGDPLLATADYAAVFRNQPQTVTPLETIADRLVASGLRELRGAVRGDESRYDAERAIATWKPIYLSDNEIGPVSALTVNDGFATYGIGGRRTRAGDPAANAARVLVRLLRERGVVMADEGAPRETGMTPPDATPLASVESPPLAEVVAQMLRESDNMTAELLVKELGRNRAGPGRGTWADGLAAVRAALVEAGLADSAYAAVDGSGLDVSDRVSCTAMMTAFDLAGADPENHRALVAGFAVAGRTGTLADRFRGHPAEGRLRAKTGSLNGVAGLVGFVDPDAGVGEQLVFALLADGLADRLASGRALQERVGVALARYPVAPGVSDLKPLAPHKESRP